MMNRDSLETTDSILGGALTIVQPRRGYRFSIDSILLGRFAKARVRDRVLELGAGCGVVAIMIASLCRAREVITVELQPELAALCARNAALNGLGAVRSIQADLRARRIGGVDPASFDLVVANPPYHAAGRGRESPNSGRRIGRGGEGATLREFVVAAKRYATNDARVVFSFGAARSAELITLMAEHSLEPKRLRFVHPRADSPAASVLLEARNNAGVEVQILPPLIIYERPGVYGDEVRKLMHN